MKYSPTELQTMLHDLTVYLEKYNALKEQLEDIHTKATEAQEAISDTVDQIESVMYNLEV